MIGWLGSVMFAICGLPQALKARREGHAEGLDLGFLLLWTGGELCTLYAVLGLSTPILYLIFNYLANLVFLAIVWRYKIWPRPGMTQPQ